MAVDFDTWLRNGTALRCILIDVGVNVASVETTRYLSSRHYIEPAGTINHYIPIVNPESIQVIERLTLDGTSSMDFGDIELINENGSIDHWLDDVWSNRSIIVRLGDVTWDKNDFIVIFNGVVEDISSRGLNIITLKMRDKLQRLNNAISETILGGTTLNSGELIPLTFGEVFNISPLLSDPATLEYQVHIGPIESIIEVRDNGVPVAFTPHLATGKFNLSANPFGKITCSVQGDKPTPWNTTISNIVQRIVTGFGGSERFLSSDLDVVNLSNFNTANPQPIGVYVESRDNVISICEQISQSIGSQLSISRTGELQLVQIALPPSGVPIQIGVEDIVQNSLVVVDKLEIKSSSKLGYCKNWTPQPNLQTGIPAEHKALYEQEWITTLSEDLVVKAAYKLTGEPEMKETYLLKSLDASNESQRLLDLFKVPRYMIEFTGLPHLIRLEKGNPVNITYPRFGLDSGKIGMVMGLSIDYATLLVKVEVLV